MDVMEVDSNFVGKAEILGAKDCKYENVEVPEWGGWVRLRSISAKQRDQFEAQFIHGNKRAAMANFRANLVCRCVVDPETDKLMFSLAEMGALGEQSAEVLDRLFEACQRINGMKTEDVDTLKKTSDLGPLDDSATD